ncbi:MAG: YdeI/OmpD-associated family protein [Phycisphaerales bacterium]
MAKTDPRVDAYIEKAQPFAKPILRRLRAVVHKACPDCAETMKWSFPHFDYRGTLCSMAAFKAHCAFGFWKAKLLDDAETVLEKAARTAMGHLGRITSVDDLPADRALAGLVKQAMKLNEDGVAAPRATKKKPPLRVPPFLAAAIRANEKALATWEAFPPSHRREYVEWVTEAKTDATRAKRLKATVEQLAEGKPRNWKYARR